MSFHADAKWRSDGPPRRPGPRHRRAAKSNPLMWSTFRRRPARPLTALAGRRRRARRALRVPGQGFRGRAAPLDQPSTGRGVHIRSGRGDSLRRPAGTLEGRRHTCHEGPAGRTTCRFTWTPSGVPAGRRAARSPAAANQPGVRRRRERWWCEGAGEGDQRRPGRRSGVGPAGVPRGRRHTCQGRATRRAKCRFTWTPSGIPRGRRARASGTPPATRRPPSPPCAGSC